MEEISGLIKKDYAYLGLDKNEATALRDGLASYIKAVRHSRFSFPTRIVPILK